MLYLSIQRSSSDVSSPLVQVDSSPPPRFIVSCRCRHQSAVVGWLLRGAMLCEVCLYDQVTFSVFTLLFTSCYWRVNHLMLPCLWIRRHILILGRRKIFFVNQINRCLSKKWLRCACLHCAIKENLCAIRCFVVKVYIFNLNYQLSREPHLQLYRFCW